MSAGLTEDEMIGSPFTKTLPREGIQGASAIFAQVMTGNPVKWEHRIRCKGGRELDVRGTMEPIVVDGDLVGAFWITEDVTDSLRVEREVRSVKSVTSSASRCHPCRRATGACGS